MTVAMSGRKVVTTAGTEVVLMASAHYQCPIAIKALSTNTGLIYIGNDGAGAVSSTTGFQLAAGEVIIFSQVEDPSEIWIDSAVNGEGVTWLALKA